MDDTQRIVKCGNLSLHSPGSFFKRWHGKYLVLYDGSKSGVKRLELFDSEIKFKKQNPSKIIPLVDCVRVVTCQRQKTTYTFEVRTSDQFYLLAAQSFQDMNDWVNCLRLVAFGQSISQSAVLSSVQKRLSTVSGVTTSPLARATDVLLEKRNLSSGNPAIKRSNNTSIPSINSSTPTAHLVAPSQIKNIELGSRTGQLEHPTGPISSSPAHSNAILSNISNSPPVTGTSGQQAQSRLVTASQAASAAASALSKTRQRQPSLLGSCKPQPPTDSPFIQAESNLSSSKQVPSLSTTGDSKLDTLTPTVRGQLIAAATKLTAVNSPANQSSQVSSLAGKTSADKSKRGQLSIQATLDEEEENMLYCSIEDNPSEHNYRVKVIETELSLRCQLKCYQLTAPTTVDQQYEQLDRFGKLTSSTSDKHHNATNLQQPVTFYQLIIGPQELTLLNDYASSIRAQANLQQQGLWSWPYQCIRRYGFDKDNCFMFEAGRKCTSGPGQFIVQTPKAYSIYQDVVKFVNELRSLSTTAGNSGAEPNSMLVGTDQPLSAITNQPYTKDDEQSQQVVVTQIPVSWAPISSSNSQQQQLLQQTSSDKATSCSGTTDTFDSRRQFFDALRQMNNVENTIQNQVETSGITVGISKENDPIHTSQSNSTKLSDSSVDCSPVSSPTSGTTTSLDASIPLVGRRIDSSSSSSSKSIARNNSSTPNLLSESKECEERVATSEETDESGYEQGDESVTSSKSSSRSKLSSGMGNRKRQVNESMSSASSTSSGGSPGHSVSRRSNGAVHAGPIKSQANTSASPSKRFSSLSNQNSASCPSVAASDDHPTPTSKLGLILNTLADQTDDFEANLIRDVYSEITKLHAKFAVTSGSTEDSMSSNSSNDGSGERSETNDEHGDPASPATSSSQGDEPMYSNLRLNALRISRARLASLDLHQADELDHHGSNKTLQNNYLHNRSSDFKTTTGNHVNRYPLQPNQPRPHQALSTGQLHHHHLHHHHHNYGNSSTNLCHPQNSNSYPIHSSSQDYLSLPRYGPMYPSVLNPIPECGEVTSQQASPKQKVSDFGSQRSINKPLREIQSTNNNEIPSSKRVSAMRANFDRPSVVETYKANPKNKSTEHCKKFTNLRRTAPGQQQVIQKGLLSTNHYVINDVQYAKISRNVCSNYEACL